MTRKTFTGYCIYKDAESTDLSIEHVIPLSLGGHDRLSIKADRKINNGIASKIDSDIANDFTVLFSRRNANAKGHSGRSPAPIAKQSKLRDKKVQLRFGKSGLEVFDVLSRKLLPEEEFVGEELTAGGISISLDAPFRFVGKTLLSAGYFAYGQDFVDQVMHSEARAFMTNNSLMTVHSDARAFDRYAPAEDDKHLIMKLLISQRKESKILLMPGYDCFGIAVGVLGEFMGFMNIPAPGHNLCNTGDYDLGHVITVSAGKLERQSFRSAVERLGEDLDNNDPELLAAIEVEQSLNNRRDSTGS